MKRIILSRTDNLGDVILTLPMAGLIKENYPNIEIIFLGKKYTQPIIERSAYIDEFVDEAEITHKGSMDYLNADAIIHVFPSKKIAQLAKKAIPLRIGTSHRIFHLLTCNKLINFSRKNSDLHEAQLNIKLLQPLGIDSSISKEKLSNYVGWKNYEGSDAKFSDILEEDKLNILFHMKSKGSAAEWPVSKYYELAENLSSHQYNIILTGTEDEGNRIRDEHNRIFDLPHVKDTTGKLQLSELIDLIGLSDGLVACSTGPLHIAAASGIHALGLYPTVRPMHAGRWGPIGEKAEIIEGEISKTSHHLNIKVDMVLPRIRRWAN